MPDRSRGRSQTKRDTLVLQVGGGGEWSTSHPGRFTPGERTPGTHCIGGWVGPRTGFDIMEETKCLAPTTNQTHAAQFMARHYTDWAIPSPHPHIQIHTYKTNFLEQNPSREAYNCPAAQEIHFYGTRVSIIVLTRVFCWIISRGRSVQYWPKHFIPPRFILIL
jgi:hypothetical protein